MDFDAKAREMVEADDWPDVQCTVGGARAAAMIIAAALKAAYDAGVASCYDNHAMSGAKERG